jgi:hypothetical protein
MGWMDAHEYLVMERTLLDRLEEAERFSLERAFHSEAVDDEDADSDRYPTAARRPSVDGRSCPLVRRQLTIDIGRAARC